MSATTKTYQDIFTLFDKKNEGIISKEKVGDYLRAIGYNPSQQQINNILSSSSKETFSFDALNQLVDENNSILQSTINKSYKDFVKAFKIFDTNQTGKIAIGDLKYMLTGLGEKLSYEEVDEILKGVSVDENGLIDYEEFIKEILSN
ncbi:hypothetical protein QEN19_000409 [Hanseniaspora menglaensis]